MQYIVYAKIDGMGRVTDIASSAFIENADGWTQIDAGTGDRYIHAQGSYMPGPLFDEYGVPCYKLESGTVVPRSAEEIEAERPEEPQEAPDDTQARLEALENAMNALMGGIEDA